MRAIFIARLSLAGLSSPARVTAQSLQRVEGGAAAGRCSAAGFGSITSQRCQVRARGGETCE